MNEFEMNSKIAKRVFTGLICFMLLFIAWGMKPWYIVQPGETAIQLQFGKPKRVINEPGIYLRTPLIDKIVYINNRICRTSIETRSLSKDLQTVDIGAVLNYRINKGYEIFKSVGSDFETIIINPFVQESLKAVVAKFTAEDLIQQRHKACDWVNNELKERLALHSIVLIDFNFIHLDFTKDFIHAVEQKQIAEQAAKTVRNLTEKVKEESAQERLKSDALAYAYITDAKAKAEAVRVRADAEAYALKAKRESITANLITLKKVEALTHAVEKWNGQLPRIVTGSNPFLEITDGV
jgi:regulator of protease activity HflC (stomatin/prohibitin superfamily)